MQSPGSNYYRASAGEARPHPPLVGSVETGTCVVGAGLAGLNTAMGLAERGDNNVTVLESRELGFGASGRNGGFVFSGFSRGEAALLDDLGPGLARDLHGGTRHAMGLIRDRIARHRIECELIDAPVLWANWFRDPRILRARQDMLREHFGVEWEWVPAARLRELLLTTRYTDALLEPGSFHFHPLRYLRGLAAAAASAGVGVHEHSPAVRLVRVGRGWRVETPQGRVDARRVVLACGGYQAGLHQQVEAAAMPIATYAMVSTPLGNRLQTAIRTRSAVYDSRFAFDYYRPLADGRLLWGGRISTRERSPGGVQRLLMRDLLRVYPQLEGIDIEHAWSGLMSYARHEMPQVGEVEPGLWVAQAFGGHGVAPTTFAGELLASAIAEDDTRWRRLSRYGLGSTFGPAGRVAAQLNYWWLQLRDRAREMHR